MSARMRERESLRDYAAEAIGKTLGKPKEAVRRDAIVRYLAWEEQGHECIYCSKAISQQQLFEDGAIDLDHILPYSRTLDDSQMNKVVCHRECNSGINGKNQRTPYEWLAASDPERYERICQHANSLLRRGLFPYPKYKRFLQKELELDKFIARQLNDTGYIARATVEYLQLLFDKPSAVLGLKGQLTSELRWQWGLDTLLEELPDSPAWDAKDKQPRGQKNRADHRHHAIDAVVVALTNRSRLQKLTKIYREGGAKQHGEILPLPWPSLREVVRDRIAKVRVSHRVERKVRGALHEETQYGPTEKPNEWVVRKQVEALSPNEVERIRDPAIRQIVLNALAEAGLESGRGKKPDAKKMKAALANLKMKSGVPIKKVRITKPELTIRPLRDEGSPTQAYVKPGSTHHLCIFEWEEKGKRKREAVFVSMLEAKRRLKHSEPVIQRVHPERSDARFVMSLSSRELVQANWKGETKLLQFKTASSTQGQIWFVLHTDARRSAEQTQYVANANTLDAQKVTVDPLGRIRWAND
jgi:CRISPR-associated endonuclease Csn1